MLLPCAQTGAPANEQMRIKSKLPPSCATPRRSRRMDAFLCFLRELIRSASRVHTSQRDAVVSIGISFSAELNPPTVRDHPKRRAYERQNREIVGSGVRRRSQGPDRRGAERRG